MGGQETPRSRPAARYAGDGVFAGWGALATASPRVLEARTVIGVP